LNTQVEEFLLHVVEPGLNFVTRKVADLLSSHGLSLLGASTRYELRLDRQLMRGQPQRLPSRLFRHTSYLNNDAPWLDYCDPVIHISFTAPHTGLGRLGRNRFIRENPDPKLATSPHIPDDSAAGGFDLSASHPTRLQSLQAILTEGDLGPTPGLPFHSAPHLLSIFYALWHQHDYNLPFAGVNE
jgi:hypothetical protein